MSCVVVVIVCYGLRSALVMTLCHPAVLNPPPRDIGPGYTVKIIEILEKRALRLTVVDANRRPANSGPVRVLEIHHEAHGVHWVQGLSSCAQMDQQATTQHDRCGCGRVLILKCNSGSQAVGHVRPCIRDVYAYYVCPSAQCTRTRAIWAVGDAGTQARTRCQWRVWQVEDTDWQHVRADTGKRGNGRQGRACC